MKTMSVWDLIFLPPWLSIISSESYQFREKKNEDTTQSLNFSSAWLKLANNDTSFPAVVHKFKVFCSIRIQAARM